MGILDWLANDAQQGGVLGQLAMMQPKFQANLLNQQRMGLLQQEQDQQQQDRAQAGAGVRQLLGRPVDDSNPMPWLNGAPTNTGDPQADAATSDYRAKYAGAPVKLGPSPADGLLKMYGDNAEPVRRLLGAIAPDKALGVLGDTAKSAGANTEWDRRQEVTDAASAQDRAERYGQAMKIAQFNSDKSDDTPQVITLANGQQVLATNRALRTAATGGGLGALQPSAAGLPQLDARAGGPTIQNQSAAQADQASADPSMFRQIGPGMVALGGTKPTRTTRTLSSAEVQQLGLPAGTVAQEDSTGKVSVIDSGKAGGDMSEFGLKPMQMKELSKQHEMLQKQSEAIRSLYRMREISDDTPSGVGAETTLPLLQAGAFIGRQLGGGQDLTRRVANAEELQKQSVQLAGNAVSQFFPRGTQLEFKTFEQKGVPALGQSTAGRNKLIDDMIGSMQRGYQQTLRNADLISNGQYSKSPYAPSVENGNAVEPIMRESQTPITTGLTGGPGQPKDLIGQARDAVHRGAPRAAVIQRLKERGVQPPGDL